MTLTTEMVQLIDEIAQSEYERIDPAADVDRTSLLEDIMMWCQEQE